MNAAAPRKRARSRPATVVGARDLLRALGRSASAAAADSPEHRRSHRLLLVALALARCAGVRPETLAEAERALAQLVALFPPAAEVLAVLEHDARLREAALHQLTGMADPRLEAAWHDPASPGWLHEAFVDDDRRALDKRILRGHRVDHRELACKTQVFSEPWMAQWLVDNTLAPYAAALGCGSLAGRAVEHRQRPLEHSADLDVDRLVVLDPACGAGHLLLPALDALLMLHRNTDARDGRVRGDDERLAHVLLHNLEGIDLDPDVVAVCRAALWLQARRHAALPLEVQAAGVVAPARGTQAATLGALARAAPDDAALAARLQPARCHVVLANPPWLSSRKTALPQVDAAYPVARVDLYACFVERALELVVPGGRVGLVLQHGWMFLRRFAAFRHALLAERATVELCAHLGRGGGFAAWADFDKVMQTALVVLSQGAAPQHESTWFRLDALTNHDKARALAGGQPTHRRSVASLREIPGWPLVYWWDDALVRRFCSATSLAEAAAIKQGIATADNQRFVRRPWELPHGAVRAERVGEARTSASACDWVPYIKGAAGKRWIEPLDHALLWRDDGRALRESPRAVLRNEAWFFEPGVAFSYIGSDFGARLHRYRSVFDVAGSSVFGADPAALVCLMNSRAARDVLESLNPTVNFQVGDVERLPAWSEPEAARIVAVLDAAFSEHEAAREASVEFVRPGPSRWHAAQAWAQRAVDRPPGAPLPDFDPGPSQPAPPEAWLSFAVGVALGRFRPDGGIVCVGERAPWSLPHGFLLLDRTPGACDALEHPACALLRDAWREHAPALARPPSLDALRDWLMDDFFLRWHLPTYERMPYLLPVASGDRGRTLLALVSIHRFADAPLERLADALAAPHGAPPEAAACREALRARVEACARRGPPAPESSTAERAVDAAFRWVVDDGVLLNAAALWPLVEPQWTAPRRTWCEIASGRAPWSATAQRYWPPR